jgi:hypothetical protein
VWFSHRASIEKRPVARKAHWPFSSGRVAAQTQPNKSLVDSVQRDCGLCMVLQPDHETLARKILCVEF